MVTLQCGAGALVTLSNIELKAWVMCQFVVRFLVRLLRLVRSQFMVRSQFIVGFLVHLLRNLLAECNSHALELCWCCADLARY